MSKIRTEVDEDHLRQVARAREAAGVGEDFRVETLSRRQWLELQAEGALQRLCDAYKVLDEAQAAFAKAWNEWNDARSERQEEEEHED